MTPGSAPNLALRLRFLRAALGGGGDVRAAGALVAGARPVPVGDLIASVVDGRIAGRRDRAREEQLWAHIQRRPETADVLEVLEHVARLEADDALPAVADLWAVLRAGCRSTSLP